MKKLEITDVDFPEGRDSIGMDEAVTTIESFPSWMWEQDILAEFKKSHDCDCRLTHRLHEYRCDKREPKRGFYILKFLQ